MCERVDFIFIGSLQRDLEFVSTRGLSDLDSPLNRYEFRQPNRTVDQQEAIKTGWYHSLNSFYSTL